MHRERTTPDEHDVKIISDEALAALGVTSSVKPAEQLTFGSQLNPDAPTFVPTTSDVSVTVLMHSDFGADAGARMSGTPGRHDGIKLEEN